MFKNIEAAPPDAILGLTEGFKKDENPKKINLGVGVYKDNSGITPILSCVKKAEELLLQEVSKSYMPISGSPAYGQAVQALLFGAPRDNAVTAHTPGGTGALRVGADYIAKFGRGAKVWLSNPTWANHGAVFGSAGVETAQYSYYDKQTMGLDFDAMATALKEVPSGDVVLLHACCHNPTGVDLNAEQWGVVSEIALDKGWIPFIDFAYQGFGDSVEEDRVGVEAMVSRGLNLFVASSFSKNLGLYCERTGAITLVGENIQPVFSQLKKVIRSNYSNPPAHGGLIATTVLTDVALRSEWIAELAEMRERIAGVRTQFVDALASVGVNQDFSYIKSQRGMFSFSGLTDDQVAYLKDEKAIYIVKGGRINVAGITSQNIDYLVSSIAECLGR